MNRFSAEYRNNFGPRVQVNRHHKNPDGKVVTFPEFTLSLEEAQELLLDLGEALTAAQGRVQFTREQKSG